MNGSIFILTLRFCFAHRQRQHMHTAMPMWPESCLYNVQTLIQAGLISQDEATGDDLTEFLPRHLSADVTEMQRHERFSFAVARTLDLTSEQLQQCLEFRRTDERLVLLHDELADGRGYLAARNSLKGLL